MATDTTRGRREPPEHTDEIKDMLKDIQAFLLENISQLDVAAINDENGTEYESPGDILALIKNLTDAYPWYPFYEIDEQVLVSTLDNIKDAGSVLGMKRTPFSKELTILIGELEGLLSGDPDGGLKCPTCGSQSTHVIAGGTHWARFACGNCGNE
jgi:hypothetical protein